MEVFDELHFINELLIAGQEAKAREKIIRLVSNLNDVDRSMVIAPLNDLIRQVGLYPYMDKGPLV